MPEYRLAKQEVKDLLVGLVNECEELEDYKEHAPTVCCVEVMYADDDAFDKAALKKLGRRPVRLVQVSDKAMRLITSEQGLAQSGNGLDFILKLDPAAWDPLPEEARQAFVFDALMTYFLERVEDKETGDMVVKMDGDHARWNARQSKQNHPETFARFGPWSKYTQAILDALTERQESEVPLFDWAASLPESKEPELRADLKSEEPAKSTT